jgi:aspartokinase-like uncharacterized kinase
VSRPRRVIRLGGSLLDWPKLPATFARWRAKQTPADDIVIVGGGKIVDALRELDRAGSLGEEAAHWLAIEGMSLTAALAVELLAGATLVRNLGDLEVSDGDGVRILDVADFMRKDSASDDSLPCSWNVTSDSIAARVAQRIKAAELVLLKSALPEDGLTRHQLSQIGYVDAHFAHAALGLKVCAVNLRAEGLPQRVL